MNFGIVKTADCVNVLPEADSRCSDPAFRIANPDKCPPQSELIIKPARALACALGSIQFKAFLVTNGTEVDVSDESVFATSNVNVALIGVASGNCTGIAQGEVTISAAYETLTATAELTVMGNTEESGDCCNSTTVAMMALVDTSRSMSQAFSGGYQTRLDFAKTAAAQFISEVNASKDTIGLISFNLASTLALAAPSSDKDAVGALVPTITQTQQKTGFYDALSAAVDALDATTSDLKVLVLMSDGEDTSDGAANGYQGTDNPIALLANFKEQGGVVICLGCRAASAGFTRLSEFATGGFFINAYSGIEQESLDFLSGLKGYICAGNCTPAGDVMEGTAALNYDAFINWTVTGGTVDLQGNGSFDFMPGNGLYVDLSGSGHASPSLGRMVSRVPFSITSGHQYRLSLKLAANPVKSGGPYSAQIKVFYLVDAAEVVILSQVAVVNGATPDFIPYSFTFTAPADVDVYISIQEQDIPGATSPDCDYGMYLDQVTFDDVTDHANLLTDTFNNENLQYIPPRCGLATTFVSGGYATGYNCYGVGCLDSPPTVQSPDPSPLSDIESGWTPPKIYTSTKTACASCPGDFTNQGDNAVPTMTSATEPSGVASASAEQASQPAWKAFAPIVYGVPLSGWAGGLTAPQWLQYEFAEAKIINIYGVTSNASDVQGWISSWQLQGSNDGIDWTTLDSQSDQNTTFANLKYAVESPQAFLYYRLYITDWNQFGVAPAAVSAFALYESTSAEVCASATATGPTQAAADAAAYQAALALAQAQLNCQQVFTATEQVTINCPTGTCGPSVTKTATATSYFSQTDAEQRARDAATELAQAEIDADCAESTNEQLLTISDGVSGPGLADPFPSVKYVTSALAFITKLTVSIYGLSHTYPDDIQMFIRGPDGTCVGLMRNCGGSSAITNVDLVFDDDEAALPDTTIITSGSYKPTGFGSWSFSPSDTPEAPTAPASFTLSDFSGLDPNGAWSLWVIDDNYLHVGQFAGGWDLTIT